MADYSMLNWYRTQQQSQNPYSSMLNWGARSAATPAGIPASVPTISNNGADWEQMPMGTNGLAPGEGMFAGSALNAPIATTLNSPTVNSPGFVNDLRRWGVIDSIDPQTGQRVGGYGGLALGAVQGLGSLYLGMQQYNLAKETLANNKAQFERNFAAQQKTTNTALEDRQRARVASNAGAYQSVGEYMNANRV